MVGLSESTFFRRLSPEEGTDGSCVGQIDTDPTVAFLFLTYTLIKNADTYRTRSPSPFPTVAVHVLVWYEYE
jgi:hypothetical protein